MRIVAVSLFVIIANAAYADDGATHAPEERGFVDRVYEDAAGEHKYVVFVPPGEPPQRGWPVILSLHGAGERGTDGRRQLSAGLGPLVKLRSATFPAVVVFPQSENFDGPILQSWSPRSPDGQRALAVLAEVERDYPTNPDQRILTGWSMGAVGAWGLAAADSSHWSALVPVSGGGNPNWAGKLTNLPIWAFHGEDDRIVSPAGTRRMVEAVRAAGGEILLSEIKNEGHDIWKRVYDSDVVLNWMLTPDASRTELEAIELPEDRTPATPFVPAMVIERALTMRLGQAAVDVIAAGLPSAVDAEGLSGKLDDVTDQVELDGREFEIRFGDLTYSAELERAVIRAYGPDRVQAEIGLRNVHLSVGHIAVTDGSVGFTASQAEVVVGHREPVWLKVEVRPAIDKQRLALKLLRSSFTIPDCNWYVREPETIALQGEWLTEEEVKTAVVGGIYFRRETIEEQVLNAVPTMLDQFGERVDLSPLEQLVEALWPLPVYHPEVRVAPESIATDDRGVSITFQVAVASIDSVSPERIDVVQATGPQAYEIAPTTDLRVGVAVDVLDHMSSLLAGTSAGRLFASDIPGRPFTELRDREAVSEALPDLASLSPAGELQTSFSLAAPLQLRPLEGSRTDDGDGILMLIEAPKLAMRVQTIEAAPTHTQTSTEPDAGEVSPLANAAPETLFGCDLSLQQPLSLRVSRDNGIPVLKMIWESDAQVSAAADANASPQQTADTERMTQLFSRGWNRWTSQQSEQSSVLPEVSLGSASMTLRDLSWEGMRLSASFAPTATQITNRTKSSIDYQVRGLYSSWSEERSLAAGDTASFATGTEVRLRPVRHWEFHEISLPAGSVWECRSADRGRMPEWVRTDQQPPTSSD